MRAEIVELNKRSNNRGPHPEELGAQAPSVSKDGRTRTVTYAIYGARGWEIRRDFNPLTIDDKHFSAGLAVPSAAIGISEMTSMASMRGIADDKRLLSIA
jgi:hypothetical protein